MDIYPKITWVWSPDTEIERVAHATSVVASGFYGRKGFVILPRATGVGSVVVPDLPYGQIEKYWERIQSVPLQFPFEIPVDLRKEMGSIVWPQVKIDQEVLGTRQREWEKVQDSYWKQVKLVMLGEMARVGEVEVRLTNWGSVSSYSFLTKKKGQKLIIYLRSDAGVEALAEAIATALLWPDHEERGLTWSKREAIVDFLLTRGELLRKLPKYDPTLSTLRGITKVLREESEEYVRHLGVPNREKELEYLEGKIQVKGVSTEGEWGKLEKMVLVKLLERRGEIVSFDEIADLMWGAGEFKTFWAINKLMQRVKGKLTRLGCEKDVLTVKRGRGYLLQ
ncbi:MAG: helix-turn-helix domain-containing protein [bacterium]